MTGTMLDNSGVGKGLLGSEYARSKKALMATVNEIRATGAAVDVDLPTIVVAGNQSSGKSSLIEAISGINLPRAVGTCTRVPIEVRLKQEDVAWYCEIKVRREGSGNDNADSRKPEVNFGARITDPTLVEASIRRAQLAILNPSVQLERFVEYILPEEEETRPLGSIQQFAFSPDVIVLEITGPNETDLTLVDLPGIIQNVGQNEDKGNIKLIEDMVNSYIRKDCIILLVITMKDDIQNQKAALLAREADPEGKRTIGVLTKVDTVTGRTETEQWLEVVQNEREKLALGYFVTRQPDADALADGISFADAREQEDAFFRKHAPWKSLDRALQKRLGTKNLAAYLSDKLSKFIKDKLPELEKQIAARHREIDAELRKLGSEPSDDPISALLSILTNFEQAIAKHIEGLPGDKGFIQKINKLNQAFLEEVKNTKPSFIAKERASPVHNESDGGSGSESDDGSDDETDSNVTDDDAPSEAAVYIDCHMYLNDMRAYINSCRTRELPNQLPPSAVAMLIERSTTTWAELSLEHLDKVKPIVQALLDSLIHNHFGKFAHGGLPECIGAIVSDRMQDLLATTHKSIEELAALEKKPFTLNTHYLETNAAKNLARLKDCPPSQTVTTAGATTSKTPTARPDAAYLIRVALLENYETELKLMAETSAYWKVAYKRLIDNIPRSIDYNLLTPLPSVMRNALLQELHVFGDDSRARCKDFLDEAPEVAEQRKDLKVRKARLGDAKIAIRKFKTK